MDTKNQEVLYENILFQNVPMEIDLTTIKNKAAMKYINSCYENNKEELKKLFPSKMIDNRKVLVLRKWGKKAFLKTVLANKDIPLESILFLGVSYQINKDFKIVMSELSKKYMEKHLNAYDEHLAGYKKYFPERKLVNGREVIVVKCKDVDTRLLKFIYNEKIIGHLFFSQVEHNGAGKLFEEERNRIAAIHKYLSKYSFGELEERFIKNEKLLNIVQVRDRKYIEVANTITLELLIKDQLNDDKVKIHTVKEQQTPSSVIDHIGDVKQPDVNLDREPIGSMRPRKLTPNVETKVKPSRKIVGTHNPAKVQVNTLITERQINLVRFLKKLYSNTCQVCGQNVEIGIDDYMSEVHHIKPLGKHNGPDIIENMIVLCPNHHVMFDRGAITIDIENNIVIHKNEDNVLHNKQVLLKHRINKEYIQYHNVHIFV